MTSPALEATQKLVQISHLPPSMNGNPILYVTSLTAMMCGAVLGLYVFFWMMKDTFRDRKHAGFRSILFNFRIMMALAGLGAFIGCMPEVLYLQVYNDPQVSESVQAMITTGKRIADSSRIFIIIGWVGFLVMIYPYVCLALIDVNEQQVVNHLQVEDYPAIGRLAKPLFVIVILALIAMGFAVSKVYGL